MVRQYAATTLFVVVFYQSHTASKPPGKQVVITRTLEWTSSWLLFAFLKIF